MEEKTDINDYLLGKAIRQEPIYISQNPSIQKYAADFGDILPDFERQWNEDLANGRMSNNPFCLCSLLGLMHQVLEDNGIAHKDFSQYFMGGNNIYDLVGKEFKKYENLLFANKAFAVSAPDILGEIDYDKLETPVYLFLLESYRILYDDAKSFIKNFKEEDYPNADYKHWKP